MRRSIFSSIFALLIAISHMALASGDEPPFLGGRYTDESLAALPEDLTSLTLRGSIGYGNDDVSDAGIQQLSRLKNLRVLNAGALGLTDKSLEAIAQLSNLEELSLDSNKINGSGLQHLTNLKKLKKLVLHFNPLMPEWPKTVSQFTSLQDLQVVNYDQPIDDDMLIELSKLTKLNRLALNDNAINVTDAGLSALASLTHLQEVKISKALVSEEGLQKLASISTLQVLHLKDLRTATPGSFTWLEKLPNLRELEIVGTPLNNHDIKSISQLSKLNSLLIWNVSWGSDSVSIEELEGLKSLRAIRTNELLTRDAIRDLSMLPQLEYIGDDLSQITDADLSELVKLKSLQSISVDSPHITTASLKALENMKSLRYLCVSDKVKLSREQLEQLGKEHLPQCKIVARYGNVIYHEPKIGP